MKRIDVIDSHTAGEPTRVVLGGVRPEELDDYRRAIICEPRGAEVLVGALLEPPLDSGNLAQVTFFNNVGRLTMCGHGTIGVIETLRHLGRVSPGVHRLETAAGVVTTTLHENGQVSVENVRAYRKAASVPAGGVTGDVAYGGNWFYLVSDHGLSLTGDRIPELLEACRQIRADIRKAGYPEVDHIELFAAPLNPRNDSRNFVFCPGDQYDRSPCGTGTSAKLACLAADEKLAPGQIWKQESIIGSVFEGQYRPVDGGIIPTITGKAYITAEAQLILQADDPYRLSIPDRLEGLELRSSQQTAERSSA